jgi:hypothetical protein
MRHGGDDSSSDSDDDGHDHHHKVSHRKPYSDSGTGTSVAEPKKVISASDFAEPQIRVAGPTQAPVWAMAPNSFI